jgi:hypothetical protein
MKALFVLFLIFSNHANAQVWKKVWSVDIESITTQEIAETLTKYPNIFDYGTFGPGDISHILTTIRLFKFSGPHGCPHEDDRLYHEQADHFICLWGNYCAYANDNFLPSPLDPCRL